MIPAVALLLRLIGAPTQDAPDLSPEARPHNAQGIAQIVAGNYPAGLDELEQAYALVPDPLRYRVGRSELLGSIRGALNHLYETTGDVAHLRRLHVHLLRHLEALAVALGDATTADDVAGTLVALRQVEAQLAREPTPTPVAPLPAPTPRPRPVVTPRPALPVPAPADGPTRGQLRIAGGISLGLGLGLLGVMAYGIAAQQRHGPAGREIDDAIDGRTITPAEYAELADHLTRARASRRLALATGLSSATLSVLGVALLAHPHTRRGAPRPRETLSLAPWWVPSGAGITMRLSLR